MWSLCGKANAWYIKACKIHTILEIALKGFEDTFNNKGFFQKETSSDISHYEYIYIKKYLAN